MYSSRVAHVHGNALMCSISSMVERSPSRTAHVWLTCTVMPSHVAFPQWWRGAPHVQLMCGSRDMVMPSRVAFPQWWRDIHVWDLLTCGGDIHMWDLLTCGGDIHVWLTCTVMPSHVAFPQWWRDIHGWDLLTCGRGIHVWDLLTCGTSHQSEILHSLIFVIYYLRCV